jgi:hypothetical protein
MNFLLLAIDMMMVYLVFSIVVSGIQEWIAQKRAMRGQFLLQGIEGLVNDSTIFKDVMAHPLISGTERVIPNSSLNGIFAILRPLVSAWRKPFPKQGDASQAAPAQIVKPPSYIDPENFALALAQVVVKNLPPPKEDPAAIPAVVVAAVDAAIPAGVEEPSEPVRLTLANLRDALALLQHKAPGAQGSIADVLLPIIDSSKDLNTALNNIQGWFSRGMDRVSGWYKSHAQWQLFMIGLLVALLANVNSIAIYQALNSSSDLASQIADQAQHVVASHTIDGINVSGVDKLSPADSQKVLQAVLKSPVAKLPIGYACLESTPDVPSTPTADSNTGAAPTSATNGKTGVALTPATNGKNGAAPTPTTNGTTGVAPNAPTHAFAMCTRSVSNLTSWSFADWLIYLLGCLLTAIAGTLGAPYWFAALADLLNIRGSGPKPDPGPAKT